MWGRFDTSNKGEMYKLTIKDTDFGDTGEYALQIGDRSTKCKLDVTPSKWLTIAVWALA